MSWPVRQLKNVCTVVAGQHIPAEQHNDSGTGTPYLTGPADFAGRETVVSKWTDHPRQFARSGDVLITVKGAGVGKSALGRDAAIGRQLMAIRPGDAVDWGYLFHWVRLKESMFAALGQGATVPGISKPDIEAQELPLPPLPEQKRIAAILDKADEARRKRAEAIRLTEELLKSAFLEMFGDPVTNPKGWEVKKLGDLTSFITSGSRGWAKYYSDEGAKFLRIQNVGRNELLTGDLAHVQAPESAEARRTRVEPGDIVLSITADLGRTAVIPDDFGDGHINQHLCLMRTTRDVLPVFVSQFLASDGGQNQVDRLNRSGVKSGLNFDDVRSLEVPVPPMAEQKRFEGAFHAIRGQRQQLARHQIQAGALSASLTQRAFRGEL